MKNLFNFKRILKISLILSFLFILLESVSAYSSLTSNKPTYGVTTTRVNFRSSPSTSSSVIRVLASGTKVKMVGVIDNYYIVQLASDEVGVVSKDYVKSSSTAPSGASEYTRISPVSANTNTSSVNVRRGPRNKFC